MRNPLGGPVATLLMFVPLLAIPLFAVFGTPQMSSTGSPAAQVEELKFAVEKDKPQTGNSLPEADLVSAVQISDASAGTPNVAGQNAAQPAAPAAASAASVAKNEADPFADFVRPADGDKPRSARRRETPTTRIAPDNRKKRPWPRTTPLPTTAAPLDPIATRPRPIQMPVIQTPVIRRASLRPSARDPSRRRS